VVGSAEDLVDAFLGAAAMNMCATRKSAAGEGAVEVLVAAVAAHAQDGAVALPVGDAILDALGFEDALQCAGLTVLRADDPSWRERLPGAAVGVTSAAIAVADQGVVALACGPGSPRGTSLLPPVHICVVQSQDVVATFAEAIERIGARRLPSALTWIGGPSRTGDLGMTLTLGVHGPRAVTVVVIDG